MDLDTLESFSVRPSTNADPEELWQGLTLYMPKMGSAHCES